MIIGASALLTGFFIGLYFDVIYMPSISAVNTAGESADFEMQSQRGSPQPYNGSKIVLPAIEINSPEDVILKRAALIDFIWKDGNGNLPLSKMPSNVQQNITIDDRFKTLRSVTAQIDKIQVAMDYDVRSDVFLFHPKNKTDSSQLIIFHAGHEQDFMIHNAVLKFFLERGYSALALSMPLHGGNNQPTVFIEKFGTFNLTSHDHFKFIESDNFSPIKYFVEPLTVSLNYVQKEYKYNSTAMIGISGGGWTTSLYSAIDPRIYNSYPVAGIMPFYLYEKSEAMGDYEQSHPELANIANRFELFILGSYGEGRSQLLIFNKDDPCCFSGDRHLAYLPVIQKAIEELGTGEFDIFIDEYKRHAISSSTLRQVLESLKSDS